jgi:predicted nucleic acid-binding protein
MKDKTGIFIDTNVLVYMIYGTAQQKEQIGTLLIPHQGLAIVSTQVLKEFTNVSIKKKLNKTTEELKAHLSQIAKSFKVFEISPETILYAIDLKDQYQYSFYDSLIIASAIEMKCSILYSEDLQHGQTISKQLKIISPFK